MPRPQAYYPLMGYKYQILARNPSYDRSWDHCDYAVGKDERVYLLAAYRLAYGAGWEFKTIKLPMKYWPVEFISVPKE